MSIHINSTIDFTSLPLVKYLSDKKSPFCSIIQQVIDDVTPQLNNRIPALFPTYTLHDTQHSFRIIKYMGELVDNIESLTDLEISILINAALLHDVGMAVSQDDVDKIKLDSFADSDYHFSVMLRLMNNDPVLAIQEYIRRIHSRLSAKYIRVRLKNILTVPGMSHLDYVEDVAKICESHTNDYDWIKANLDAHAVRGDYSYNPQYIACILRLGDILDIDGQRTPYRLFELINPKGKSDNEWQQHFVIFNNEKISVNERTKLRFLVFHGKVKKPDIHRKILTYIDWVETELFGALSLTNSMKNKYYLPFEEKAQINIQSEGYTFSGYKMTLKFDAISSLLMGDKIYGSKSLGLRELIQNSLDACKIRKEKEKPKFGDEPYIPIIKVLLNKDTNEVIIKDNGTGMSLDIIKNHFLNIGVSYYQSFDFMLNDLNYKPIGNYGIGFLSCYMLSDAVQVKTRYYLLDKVYTVELERGNEWTSLTESKDQSFFGTEVKLRYDQFMSVFDNKNENILEFLNKFFLTDAIEFKLITKKDTFEIKNCLQPTTETEKGFISVSLAPYLKELDGYALIKPRRPFIKGLKDVSFDSDVYIFNPPPGYPDFVDNEPPDDWNWLDPVKNLESTFIDDFIDGDTLKYLSIPIIDRANVAGFENGMKFTGYDTREVVEKMEDELYRITILVGKHYQSLLKEGEINRDDDIINGLNFRELKQMGQELFQPTYKFVKTINLFEGRKNELYISFERTERDLFPFYRKLPNKSLFIRSVLIKDFFIKAPFIADILEISNTVVNIISRKFVPDISRNNLDNTGGELINYVIGKAIHKAAVDTLEISDDERRAFNDFLLTYYSTETEFEKQKD